MWWKRKVKIEFVTTSFPVPVYGRWRRRPSWMDTAFPVPLTKFLTLSDDGRCIVWFKGNSHRSFNIKYSRRINLARSIVFWNWALIYGHPFSTAENLAPDSLILFNQIKEGIKAPRFSYFSLLLFSCSLLLFPYWSGRSGRLGRWKKKKKWGEKWRGGWEGEMGGRNERRNEGRNGGRNGEGSSVYAFDREKQLSV